MAARDLCDQRPDEGQHQRGGRRVAHPERKAGRREDDAEQESLGRVCHGPQHQRREPVVDHGLGGRPGEDEAAEEQQQDRVGSRGVERFGSRTAVTFESEPTPSAGITEKRELRGNEMNAVANSGSASVTQSSTVAARMPTMMACSRGHPAAVAAQARPTDVASSAIVASGRRTLSGSGGGNEPSGGGKRRTINDLPDFHLPRLIGTRPSPICVATRNWPWPIR